MATNFINNIMANLNSGKKDAVHIAISPNRGLEIAQIDSATSTVTKYGVKPLEYNEALKEIKNYTELKQSLEELFTELQINPKSNIVLSIPTVHIGKIELPLILSDEMVNEAIISEVEQAYIFKRCEPIVSWVEVLGNQDSENRTMIYSAIQKPVVDSVKEVLTSFGATLDRLEISLTSDLRALSYANILKEQIQGESAWTLMVIKSNGYELVQLKGQKIFDYYTEPLALKTYELEEIYDAIYTSVQIALLNYPTNNMVILSETDMVSAEHMASKMQIDGNITYVENNEYKKQDFIPVSLEILPDIASKISLEAVGIAAIDIHEFQSVFEFTGNKKSVAPTAEPIRFTFHGKEYVITESTAIKLIAIIGAVLIVPSLIAMLILNSSQKNLQTKLDDVNAKMSNLDSQIAEYKDKSSESDFDVASEIEKVIKNNRAKLIAYSSLGESVPKKLWLNYFKTKEDGKIDIIGVSENVEDIYIFYRNLKDSIIDSQLRLHRLEMQSNSVEDAISSSSNYEFEITNMADEDLKKEQASSDNNNNNNNNNNDNKGDNGNSNAPKSGNGKAVKDLEEVEVH